MSSFPQNSANSPLGFQFGRERAIFETEEFDPTLWDKDIAERAYEETNRLEDQPALEHQRVQAISASRAEADVIAMPVERKTSHEMDEYNAATISHVGKLVIMQLRDGVDLAA